MFRILAVSLIAMSLSGCLYRPDLNQGNHIDAESIEKLKPNLTKHQVQQIMGTTALTPIFEKDEWNYSYGHLDGKDRGQPLKINTITLYFKDGKLQSYISNEWHPSQLPKHK